LTSTTHVAFTGIWAICVPPVVPNRRLAAWPFAWMLIPALPCNKPTRIVAGIEGAVATEVPVK
jgi:hypothetical protein